MALLPASRVVRVIVGVPRLAPIAARPLPIAARPLPPVLVRAACHCVRFHGQCAPNAWFRTKGS